MPTFKELTERFKSSGCELYTNEEYHGIEIIKSYTQDDFDIQRTNEGCMADLLVKPNMKF